MDPRALGCRCDECALGCYHRALGTFAPVLPEVTSTGRTNVAIIAEAPGGEEVRQRRPLIGNSGQEMMRTLAAFGVQRADVTLDNGILCNPPLNELKRFRVQTELENAKRVERGEVPLLDPIVACRPHVLRRVRETPNVLLVGATSYESMAGKRKPIRKIRGALTEHFLLEDDTVLPFTPEAANVLGPLARRLRAVPTLHPAFVLRSQAWRPVLWQDVGRFFRWITGQLRWTPPVRTFIPAPEQLYRFLFDPNIPFHSCDIETGGEKDRRTKVVIIDGRDVGRCHLRCIGVGAPDGRVMVVPFRSVTGDRTLDGSGAPVEIFDEDERRWRWVAPSAYYSQSHAKQIAEIWREWLLSPRLKCGHNFLQFDTTVLRRVLKLSGNLLSFPGTFDTIFAFRAAHSELSRDLYTLGTLYSDVPDWKAAADDRKIAQNPRNDIELWDYNSIDCKVNAQVMPMLWKRVVERKQEQVVQLDHQVQAIMQGAQTIGLRVDQVARAKKEVEYEEKTAKALKTILDTVGDQKFNPRSTKQRAKLFYEDWKLPVLSRTETGLPGVDDGTLRKFIYHRVLTREQHAVIDAMRVYSKAYKLLNTYIRKLRIGSMCHADGRLHPKYNVFIPNTGRISSSKPNAQNLTSEIVALIIPEPGMVFIGADYDQIELRLFAAMAAIESYLKVFREGGDPHSVTATALYGQVFVKELEIKKKTGQKTKMFEALRRLAKVFIYAVLYGGTAMTIWESVSSAEDPETGKLVFPDMSLSDIRLVYDTFMTNLPEIKVYWNKVEEYVGLHGVAPEPIMGRVRDFPQYDQNEALNMGIQGGAAVIMGLGLLKSTAAIPFDLERRIGLVNQCHDAVVFQVPEAQAEQACQQVEEALTMDFPDRLPGVRFTTKAKSGYSWAEVK